MYSLNKSLNLDMSINVKSVVLSNKMESRVIFSTVVVAAFDFYLRVDK